MVVVAGKLEVELASRKSKAVLRFRQFEKVWGTRHLVLVCGHKDEVV
jgi:hypothetical protein